MQRKSAGRRLNFPELRGFEFLPEGRLLSQRVDFEGPVGIAYERCIGYTKPPHTHDRVTISCPRGSSRSFIKVFPEEKTFQLHQGLVHIMAQDQVHEQGSLSSVYDTFALFVSEKNLESRLRLLGATGRQVESLLRTTRAIPRSAFLNELLDRYFFRRVVQQSASQVELEHLESLILFEIFRAEGEEVPSRGTGSARAEPPVPRAPEHTALMRALELIESRLFEKLDVPALVHSSRASQATLFRLFKSELGLSPLEYVRNRRLDEARTLLRTGEYQVSDIALLVGYEDLSSFSRAFKTRFRVTPSAVLPKQA